MKNENIWFVGENGEGKRGKYLEKESIFFLQRRRKTEKEKEENIWRKIFIFFFRRKTERGNI